MDGLRICVGLARSVVLLIRSKILGLPLLSLAFAIANFALSLLNLFPISPYYFPFPPYPFSKNNTIKNASASAVLSSPRGSHPAPVPQFDYFLPCVLLSDASFC